MTVKEGPSRRRILGFSSVLVGIVVLGIFLTVGGFTFAASQEARDPFCASCHTQPESTYVQRSTDAHPVDLASFHTGEETRCIDCHSGVGIGGRVQAELLGARNALAWYTSFAEQSAHITFPLQDENCLKCHQDVIQQGYTPKQTVTISGVRSRGGGEAGPNHWHDQMARWQAADPKAGLCTSCHLGHGTAAKRLIHPSHRCQKFSAHAPNRHG